MSCKQSWLKVFILILEGTDFLYGVRYNIHIRLVFFFFVTVDDVLIIFFNGEIDNKIMPLKKVESPNIH